MPPSSPAAAAPQKPGGRKSAALPHETVEYLKAWMMSPEHVAHPYPTEQEKAQIMYETGIELKQLTNWFVNNRKRYWKPRVEAKLQKYQGPGVASSVAAGSAVAPAKALSNVGLSLAIQRVNPKPAPQPTQPVVPLPVLLNSAPPVPLLGSPAQAVGNPISPSQTLLQVPSLAGPQVAGPTSQLVQAAHRAAYVRDALSRAAAAAAASYRDLDDPHTISDGSASGDDDSVGASARSFLPVGFGSTTSQPLAVAPGAVPISRNASSASLAAGYRRHEEVDIHILRPASSAEGSDGPEPLPTLRDLTIKTSVPPERVLATFKCPISYNIPYDIENDRKKVQSRRDGEVLRVKKHYLKLYLATRGIASTASPPLAAEGGNVPPSTSPVPFEAPRVSISAPVVARPDAASPAVLGSVTASSEYPSPPSRRRALDDTEGPSRLPPRKRARSASGILIKGEDEWRALCQHASSLYCESLPGLEEAARMFGLSP
ncbi:hypothetical protein ACHAWF_014708 [Thalassiosira exigua]